MRLVLALPVLLAAAGCDVDSDRANGQMTLEYNEQRIRDAADAAGRTAEEVGTSVGNVAADTGRAIKNEVGDLDVDVDVRRDRDGEAAVQANAQ